MWRGLGQQGLHDLCINRGQLVASQGCTVQLIVRRGVERQQFGAKAWGEGFTRRRHDTQSGC